MRWVMMAVVLAVCGWGIAVAEAREKPISELPKDVWDIAFMWTEPLKQVGEQSRRSDPVSGLWLGLLDGSIKSVERTTKFFLFQGSDSPTSTPESGKQLRYSF